MLLQLIYFVKRQLLHQKTVMPGAFFLSMSKHKNPPSATIDRGIALMFNLSYAWILRKDLDESSHLIPVACAPHRL